MAEGELVELSRFLWCSGNSDFEKSQVLRDTLEWFFFLLAALLLEDFLLRSAVCLSEEE